MHWLKALGWTLFWVLAACTMSLLMFGAAQPSPTPRIMYAALGIGVFMGLTAAQLWAIGTRER